MSPTSMADPTAVRVALWRALHLQVDPPPHVFEDEVGLRLAAPEEGWLNRPDMNPDFTRPFRASIVARARFMDDLVAEQVGKGIPQYVILGAGLDTFAQRRLDVASRLRVYEIDKPGPQAWKRQRLIDLGYGIPEWLRLVPVDFEAGPSWWEKADGCRLRRGRASNRGLNGRQHVPDQGGNRSHAAPGRLAGCRLHAGHDLSAADRDGGPGGARWAGDGG